MEMLWLLGTGGLGLILLMRDWRREQWVRGLRAAARPAPAPVQALAVQEESPDAGE